MDVKSKPARQFIRTLSKLGLSSATEIASTAQFAIQDLMEALEAGMCNSTSDLNMGSAMCGYLGIEDLDPIMTGVVFDINNFKVPDDN
jgi:hypothetical protein